MNGGVLKSEDICVLASGGLDSSILLGLMAHQFQRVYPLYIRCGLQWEKAELYWLKKFLKKLAYTNIQPLQILDLPVEALYQKHWSLTGRNIPGLNSDDREVYLPGRNILLLSQAAVFCSRHQIKYIALGTLKGNPFPDSQRSFFSSFERMIKVGLNHPIKILTPFSELSKHEILKLGKDLPLELTFSCLKPHNLRPCGKCNKCGERSKIE